MKSIHDIIDEGISNDKLWNAIDEITNILGADKFLIELCKAMSDDNLKQCIQFIAKNNEIKIKL